MNKSFDLLAAVVDSDEKAMLHWDGCKECQGNPRCSEGLALMGAHVEACLAAKIFVDRVRQGLMDPFRLFAGGLPASR